MDEFDEYLNQQLNENPVFRAWYEHNEAGACLTCRLWGALPLIGKRIWHAHERAVLGGE